MNRKLFLASSIIIILTAVSVVLASALNLLPWTSREGSDNSLTDAILLVDGSVEQSLNLTLEQLKSMPQTTVDATLYCVDFPNNPVEEGNWTGVRLSLLMNTTRVSSRTLKVAFHASDGFSTDLTVEDAKREDVIVAYQLNGQPLSEKTRLVVPGKWGYKWISKLNHIEFVDYDFKGFWESRGYSDDAWVVHGPKSPLGG